MGRRRGAMPTARWLSKFLTEREGREIVHLETLPITAGQVVRLRFVSAASPYRAGVWLGTEGVMRLHDFPDEPDDQFAIWMDTAPPVVELTVDETDGLLRVYNIFDSGKGIQPYERLTMTSGMLRVDKPDGVIEFRCIDRGRDASFDRLVFELTLL